MRGRFWRKVIIKRGKNVAYPDTIDSFRTTENRPGIKYDPAKKTTLFAEDLKALGDSIISVQNAIGNFDLDDGGTIFDRLYNCVTYDDLKVQVLYWDATIKQLSSQFKIVPLFSRAIVVKGIVQAIAYYKAPDKSLLHNLYVDLPNRAMHESMNVPFYGLNAIEFQYYYNDPDDQYFGHGTARYNDLSNNRVAFYWQKTKTGYFNSQPQVASETVEWNDTTRHFIKDSIIKVKLEYLAYG